jgi:hypothetical protein
MLWKRLSDGDLETSKPSSADLVCLPISLQKTSSLQGWERIKGGGEYDIKDSAE